MNIEGLKALIEKDLPVMENTFIFKELKDIPQSHLNKYKDKKLWAIRAFDIETKITDNPYKIKNPRKHAFSKKELSKKFKEVNFEIENLGVEKAKRIFLICRSFSNEDVLFSGHAYKEENKIFIDFLMANRPSGKDWTPDFSFIIPLINKKPQYSAIIGHKLTEEIIKICADILKFEEKVYRDFTKLKEGYFFYHDLSQH